MSPAFICRRTRNLWTQDSTKHGIPVPTKKEQGWATIKLTWITRPSLSPGTGDDKKFLTWEPSGRQEIMLAAGQSFVLTSLMSGQLPQHQKEGRTITLVEHENTFTEVPILPFFHVAAIHMASHRKGRITTSEPTDQDFLCPEDTATNRH